MKKYIASVLLLILLITAGGCGQGGTATSAQAPLVVKVLDIGQGDAILIREGGTVTLVDTGDVPARDKLVSLLRAQNIKEIDNVVITHPHADHLGGMAAILEHFAVKHIYDSGQTTTSAVYRNYLAAVKKKNIPFTVVTPGDEISLGEGRLIVLAPKTPHISGTDSDLNNNSVVLQLQYKNFTMLLAGDAEQQEEAQLLNTYGSKLKSTILKSGHHGSNTASGIEFLKAVSPEAAIISVGAHNDYHHPHPSTIKKYQNMNIKIYRTNRDGTVTVTSDGQKYDIVKEKNS